MGNKVRFNCMMKASTRDKLHRIAVEHNRSDSNMVEYLIDSYKLKQQEEDNNSAATDEESGQEVKV